MKMDLGKSKILLTGSQGKLGRRIKKRLMYLGTSHIVQFDRVLGQDLLDNNQVRQACSDSNATIHLAGLSHPGMAGPGSYLWVNTIGSAILLEEAVRAKHSKFIFVSSGAVYGWDLDPPVNISAPVSECTPLAYTAAEPYTVSKIMAEQALTLLGSDGRIKVIILRLAPIWNEGEEASPKYLYSAVSAERAVDAIINSLGAKVDNHVSIYNIADPERCGNYSIDKALRDGIIQ